MLKLYQSSYYFLDQFVGWVTGIGVKTNGHNSGYYLHTTISAKIEHIMIFMALNKSIQRTWENTLNQGFVNCCSFSSYRPIAFYYRYANTRVKRLSTKRHNLTNRVNFSWPFQSPLLSCFGKNQSCLTYLILTHVRWPLVFIVDV